MLRSERQWKQLLQGSLRFPDLKLLVPRVMALEGVGGLTVVLSGCHGFRNRL